jgi:hypothetical protein
MKSIISQVLYNNVLKIQKIAKNYLMSEKNISDPLSIIQSIIKEYKE